MRVPTGVLGVGGGFLVENKGKGEGGGEGGGWGRGRQRWQVNAQALSKLPFSKLLRIFAGYFEPQQVILIFRVL